MTHTRGSFNAALRTALDRSLARIRRHHRALGDKFPTYGEGKRYRLAANENWFAGFWPGLLWLTSAATGDADCRVHAESLLPTFADRLEKRLHLDHDLGFLFTLSARAQWQLTGDPSARQLGLRAAEALKLRFNQRGRYIQAWGPVGDAVEGGRVIVDAMMNLPLLFWASAESGDSAYRQAAVAHAETTRRYLLRGDGGTYHTYFFDQATGQPLGPRTDQGYADDSLWARGQAWAIYGFALAAEWSGETEFLAASRRAVERFMAELPAGRVPLWDLRLPPGAPRYLDSSASAIAAGGLLRLASVHNDAPTSASSGEPGAAYRQLAIELLLAVCERCFETDDDAWGLLRDGTYDAPHGEGAGCYLSFGDYYFLEALLTLAGQAPDFWGPLRSKSLGRRKTCSPILQR